MIGRYVKKNWFLLMALIFSLFLFSCEGDDGSQGVEGTSGATLTTSLTETTLTITDATITNGIPSVEFSVEDKDGTFYANLTVDNIRFTLAKLIPLNNGDSSHWQSYINITETKDAGEPGTTVDGTTAIHSHYERNETAGAFVNNGDGTYSYTFEMDITNVTSPLAVAYNATLTHRIGMQLDGGGLPAANATYDFVPNGSVVTETREVVMVESCNECHEKLGLHGGGRILTKYCVTCHTPDQSDANSGNNLDFKVYIHKIHMGEDLPSVISGTHYTIWGYRNGSHDYSDLVFPQDIRNCTKCHDGSDSATPQGNNWKTTPSLQACGSCHDNVVFGPISTTHADSVYPGGYIVTDNSACAGCHTSGGAAGAIDEDHLIPIAAELAKYQYNIDSVAFSTTTGIMLTFSVTDPRDGSYYDILNDVPFTCFGGSGRYCALNIDVAWDTDDYTNTGGGSPPSRAMSFSAKGASTVDNGDGTFSISTTLPASALLAGSGTVAIEGHPGADLAGSDGVMDANVPVTSVVKYFAITDGTVNARREVVDIAKCQNCHGVIGLLMRHGDSRNNEIKLCVMCHNPNNTDIEVRPNLATSDTTDSDGTPDSQQEESIDFKRMIHAIHGSEKRESGYYVYGYRGLHNYSSARFPGILKNCETCHKVDSRTGVGTYELPLGNNVLPSTVNSAPGFANVSTILAEGVAVADPTDDLKISPTASVCSSCHDTQLAQIHMQQNGGSFFVNATTIGTDFTNTEACAICHAAGKLADVKEVHGIE